MKVKLFVFGFLTWLIPFVLASCLMPFMELTSPLFKSLMVVTGALAGMFFLHLYFKNIDNNFLKEGVLCGIIWFAINIILDLIVLVAMLKTPLAHYMLDVGLRYLTIPIMCIGVGIILENK